MVKELKWFIKRKLLVKDETAKKLADNYIKKARNNIVTMEVLSKAPNFKDILKLPNDYDSSEWVVISAYYSMYLAALSLLAKLGYRSKNHSATSKALEDLFVKKKILEKEYIKILENIKLQKEEVEELNKVRDRREIAQYSVTKETTKDVAERTKKDARKFVDRMEELFNSLD